MFKLSKTEKDCLLKIGIGTIVIVILFRLFKNTYRSNFDTIEGQAGQAVAGRVSTICPPICRKPGAGWESAASRRRSRRISRPRGFPQEFRSLAGGSMRCHLCGRRACRGAAAVVAGVPRGGARGDAQGLGRAGRGIFCEV